jgi:ribonucleoside-triphosphate reductase
MEKETKKESHIEKIRKRDGRVVDFEKDKINNAVHKAIVATNQGDGEESKRVSEKVFQLLEKRFKKGEVPTIEQIQDIVEEALILEDFVETAKAYILYRDQRRAIREASKVTDESSEKVDSYLKELDWQVKENANMTYSLQGLNQYVGSYISKKYWLNKIYPKEIRDAASNEDFHIHNLELLAPYCAGWDLYDFLVKGFGGVEGKLEARPPKHFRTALGQLVNVLFTLQGETAGANAVSNFDTLLAPFIRYDKLDYKQVKQAMQEFLYNCMVPTRVGFQTPFLNVSIDINPPAFLANQPVIIGGEPQNENYGEFQEERNMLIKAFYEGLMEGDASGRPFTFPIPTVSITKDFDWDNPSLVGMWEATAKYGINYFSNFIHSDMSPDDARSMCCRLRLDNRELYKRGGGLFGSSPKTGSIGVVTIDLPRIGYLSKTKTEFFERLSHLMELAKESLEIKRKALDNFMEKGLYPYSRYYLADVKKMRDSYFGNHFSTIGIMGMNEALLNFLDEDVTTTRGKKFAIEILDYMREKMIKFQEETGNLYNLEATPGEGTSYRQARTDKEKYPDIITAGTKEVPYYTNSSQLPVGFTDDVFEALELQNDLQTKYTGGTVLHVFLGEKISDPLMAKNLVKKIFEKYSLPYITLTPTFSICPTHGYIAGEHFECPQCTIKQPCEVYSRVVGYIRPVQQWHKGKQQEYKERKEFKELLQVNEVIKKVPSTAEVAVGGQEKVEA